jgi:predicted phage tail protein
MAISISLPSVLGDRTGEETVEVEARTLREAIDKLEVRYPGFRSDLLTDAGNVRPSLAVLVNGRVTSDLEEPMPDNAVVGIVQEIAGG